MDWRKYNREEIYLARDFEINTSFIKRSNNPDLVQYAKGENEAIIAHPAYQSWHNIFKGSLRPFVVGAKQSSKTLFKEKYQDVLKKN